MQQPNYEEILQFCPLHCNDKGRAVATAESIAHNLSIDKIEGEREQLIVGLVQE